jgi:hypothetical protein
MLPIGEKTGVEAVVQVGVQDHIATVVMHRPPVNAQANQLREELITVFDSLTGRDDVPVAVLTGFGSGRLPGPMPRPAPQGMDGGPAAMTGSRCAGGRRFGCLAADPDRGLRQTTPATADRLPLQPILCPGHRPVRVSFQMDASAVVMVCMERALAKLAALCIAHFRLW